MGHGWVTPNIDGSVARCGGPGICEVCNKEQLIVGGNPIAEVVEPSQDWHMKVEEPQSFGEELQKLINRYSVEDSSGTPDFILAKYLQDCLNSFSAAVNWRETWYGRN
jgi:hypothetical protein